MTPRERVSVTVERELPAAGSSDVIDAVVVLLAHDGDEIYTSNPEDLRPLAQAAGRHVDLILL